MLKATKQLKDMGTQIHMATQINGKLHEDLQRKKCGIATF